MTSLNDLLGLSEPAPADDVEGDEEVAKPPETPEQIKQRQYESVLERLKEIPKENQQALPESGHIILKYNLNDFGGTSFYDIIDLCERLQVPWTYQLCGDGNREIGIKNLYLDNEPIFFTPDLYSKL